jgi:isopentenyl-diphosphate delta-isomerase
LSTGSRKADHIDICLKEDVETEHNWNDAHLIHRALPEIDFDNIDTSCNFLGHKLSAPILISSITGGTRTGRKINRALAKACQQLGLGMGLGSQRVMLEDKATTDTFQVRDIAPDIFLYSNIGAVQLNYGYWAEHIENLVDSVGANAVALHMNPLQEICQKEGDMNFGELIPKIKDLTTQIKAPVIAKETGAGISREVALDLKTALVRALLVDGKGGTSFCKVEQHRHGRQELFSDWGIPTPVSILECKGVLPVVAGGGIRDGIHVAKSIALGAEIGSLALPLLKPAMRSSTKVVEYLENLIHELKVAMFLTGSSTISELKLQKTVLTGLTLDWAIQRKLI